VLSGVTSILSSPLRASVADLCAPVAAAVHYHLGWATVDGEPTDGPAGKATRGALALLAAEASGDAEAGIPGAVSIELVHNFTLLHDDVMERDEQRRHRPAAWAVFGENMALLAGTAMLDRAHTLLMKVRPLRPLASSRLGIGVQSVIAGQAIDLQMETALTATVAEWTAMADSKTAALLRTAVDVGATLAGGTHHLRASLRSFASHLGLAFQAADDIDGIWGDPEPTGKPAGSDLQRRKKSLPVVIAMNAGGPAAEELQRAVADLGSTANHLADMITELGAVRAPKPRSRAGGPLHFKCSIERPSTAGYGTVW
jgi:geranylgeranyl diphosphate synthase type I